MSQVRVLYRPFFSIVPFNRWLCTLTLCLADLERDAEGVIASKVNSTDDIERKHFQLIDYLAYYLWSER